MADSADPNDWATWPDFNWEFVEPKRDFWIHASESGNLDQVASFISAFLRRFRPTHSWGLTWAETCSKPRIGEFGGGAVFVTATSIALFTAHDWLARQRADFESSASR
jgi:hypothetical protein